MSESPQLTTPNPTDRRAFAFSWDVPSGITLLQPTGDLVIHLTGPADVLAGYTGPWIACPTIAETAATTMPLRVPGLYRALARLTRAPQCVTFAQEHGFLTEFNRSAASRFLDLAGITYCGQPVTEWQHHARRLRFLLELWGLLQAGATDRLHAFLRWHPRRENLTNWKPRGERRAVEFHHDAGRWLIAASLADDEDHWTAPLLDRWSRDDPRGPVEFFLRQQVNAVLLEAVSVQLDPLERGRVLYRPHSLLGALYVQFMYELQGWASEPETAPLCRVCGRPILNAKRPATKRTCSDACRAKLSYRARHGAGGRNAAS